MSGKVEGRHAFERQALKSLPFPGISQLAQNRIRSLDIGGVVLSVVKSGLRNFGVADYNSGPSPSGPASTVCEDASISASSWQRTHIVAHGTISSRFSLMSSSQRMHSPY